MRDRELVRSLVVEFIGPFALTFMGVGAIIATQGQNLVAIALAHGLAIGLPVTAVGHISGGVFNPALTVGLWVTRRITPDKAIAYIVAQVLGATAGAWVLTLCYRDLERNADGVNLGVVGVGKNLTPGNALAMEIVLTFFLMFVVFGTALDPRGNRVLAGLAIGLTITMDIFAGGAVSGAAMNPARAIGPSIIQLGDGNWGEQWIYWVGPIVGAVLAAFLYHDFLIPGADRVLGRAAEPTVSEMTAPDYAREPAAEAAAQRSRRAQRRNR